MINNILIISYTVLSELLGSILVETKAQNGDRQKEIKVKAGLRKNILLIC